MNLPRMASVTLLTFVRCVTEMTERQCQCGKIFSADLLRVGSEAVGGVRHIRRRIAVAIGLTARTVLQRQQYLGNPLVRRRRVPWCRNDFELCSRVHAQKLVFSLPQSNSAQATLSIASESLFGKDLSEPSYLTEIGLNHLKTRRSIDRPKPFERSVDLGLAKPEFLAHRPQASTADYRVGDCFVPLFLPDDLCAVHFEASDALARAYHATPPRPASPPQQSPQPTSANNLGARVEAAVGSAPTGSAKRRSSRAADERGLSRAALWPGLRRSHRYIACTPADCRPADRRHPAGK